jgi:hypothetical protein
MEEQLHPLIRLLLHTLGHMTVNIQGKAGRGMTQVAQHRFDIITSFQGHHRIAVTKLVEAENRAFLVGAENRICYNADRLWLCRGLFLHERKNVVWHERAGSTRL